MIEYPRQNILEISELKKAIDRIGLVLSESQLNDLNMGKTILLENIPISEVGSVLIIASAIFATNQSLDQTSITFKDLSKKAHNCSSCPGIPILCCQCEFTDQIHCVYLTFINGIPALKICCHLKGILRY